MSLEALCPSLLTKIFWTLYFSRERPDNPWQNKLILHSLYTWCHVITPIHLLQKRLKLKANDLLNPKFKGKLLMLIHNAEAPAQLTNTFDDQGGYEMNKLDLCENLFDPSRWKIASSSNVCSCRRWRNGCRTSPMILPLNFKWGWCRSYLSKRRNCLYSGNAAIVKNAKHMETLRNLSILSRNPR